MAVFWYKKHNEFRKKMFFFEMKKNILKSLFGNRICSENEIIYFNKIFRKFSKNSAISFYRRYCVITGNSKSVFRRFKMVRH